MKSKLPIPVSNIDNYLLAIINGDISTLPEPISNTEHYLQAIANKIAQSGVGGGKDGREIELTTDDQYIKWRYVGEEWQNLIAKSELGGGASSYTQVTKLGVTATAAAPKVVELPIAKTTTFCLAPVEVLKFTQGEQNVVSTACEFDNADAKDFVYNANYVDFDGTMKLKTSFDVKMSTPSLLGNYYISESDEINFADYKKVEG